MNDSVAQPVEKITTVQTIYDDATHALKKARTNLQDLYQQRANLEQRIKQTEAEVQHKTGAFETISKVINIQPKEDSK